MCKEVLKDLLTGCLKNTKKSCFVNYDSGSNSSSNDLFDSKALSGYLQLSDVVCKSNCFTSLNKRVKLTNDLKGLN